MGTLMLMRRYLAFATLRDRADTYHPLSRPTKHDKSV
jgi:hypothetical protein